MKTGRGKYPERISIRVSTDIKENLDRLSTKDDRSLANYIRRILRHHVDKPKNKKFK